jgi:hypothetical protein
MHDSQKHIAAIFLKHCAPEKAYDWLAERSRSGDESLRWSGDNVLEYLLLRRTDPLIDVGLAQFAS